MKPRGGQLRDPEYTANADGIGTCASSEAIRILGLEKEDLLLPGPTSELYGLVQEIPQKETTPFIPRSPYAVPSSTLTGSPNYREAYGIYASQRHPQPRVAAIRGETFVTRKITRAGPHRAWPAWIARTWATSACATGATPSDYVEMQWLMLQQDNPEDFVSPPAWCTACASSSSSPAMNWARRALARARRTKRHRRDQQGSQGQGGRHHRELSTRATSAPPKSKPCSATRPRPGKLRLDAEDPLQELVKEMVPSDYPQPSAMRW